MGTNSLSYFSIMNLMSSVNLSGLFFISSFSSSKENTSIPELSPSTNLMGPS